MISIFLGLGGWGWKSIKNFKEIKSFDKKTGIIIFSFLMIYTIAFYFHNQNVPIDFHDTLVYTTEARQAFDDKSLEHRFVNNFHYPEPATSKQSFHFPSFLLLFTWDLIVNDVFNLSLDTTYYSFINYYYVLLIVLLGIALLTARKRYFYALLWPISLSSSYIFFKNSFETSVDMMRTSLLGFSLYYFYQFLKENKKENFLLFCLAGGLSSSVHTINALVSLLLPFFVENIFCRNQKKYTFYYIFFFICSGSYYLFQLLGEKSWLSRLI
ncbi:MAG: hypothetical protein H6621_04435 [Halobacteriovoraceae bacterium]|nr:hypothetical protein [Halobacteriovoraceae bacterium]